MRIGVMAGAGDGLNLDQLVAQAQRVEAAGFASLWMANIFSLDAIHGCSRTSASRLSGNTKRSYNRTLPGLTTPERLPNSLKSSVAK